jgi:hypothetical protein
MAVVVNTGLSAVAAATVAIINFFTDWLLKKTQGQQSILDGQDIWSRAEPMLNNKLRDIF